MKKDLYQNIIDYIIENQNKFCGAELCVQGVRAL